MVTEPVFKPHPTTCTVTSSTRCLVIRDNESGHHTIISMRILHLLLRPRKRICHICYASKNQPFPHYSRSKRHVQNIAIFSEIVFWFILVSHHHVIHELHPNGTSKTGHLFKEPKPNPFIKTKLKRLFLDYPKLEFSSCLCVLYQWRLERRLLSVFSI